MNDFKIIKKDARTKARLGLLRTPHGTVRTPSYVMVGTYGQIRNLSPRDIKRTKTQIIIANTYHLWDKTEDPKFKIHKRLGAIPTMTDSGGFQVFSLAFGREKGVKKIFPNQAEKTKKLKRKNIKITEKGVYFKIADPASLKLRRTWKFLSPEISMKIQEKLGADIIFAFDELTYLLDNYKYTKKSLERTNRWAKTCLKIHKKTRLRQESFGEASQMLFGITQGGPFKDLRIRGARFIGSLPFDGFGIGGSFGKKEMTNVLKWTIPHLPEEKPRHLLGVGKIEDIFRAVENGVDLFDCVIPTREARHGRLYTENGRIDIRRRYFSKDKKVIESGCGCSTCKSKVNRSKIRELIKSHDRTLNNRGQRWCLMHNMWFFNNLLEDIRNSITRGKLKEFKKKFLANVKA